jgi:hypothetical protein
MRNTTPDGKTIQELVESALEGHAAAAASEGTPNSGCLVGEVLDTHNPHLPGRVFVRWLSAELKPVELWVKAERHLRLRKGDRVILTLPTGWKQWIVTGALGPDLPAETPEVIADDVPELQLEPGQAVRIVNHDGSPLVTVRQGTDGPEIQLGTGNVELKASRTLRISADTIELHAEQGGVDLRTKGDAIVRARTIRLN